MFTSDILTNILLIKSNAPSCKWQYPILNILSHEYSYEYAQSLLQFSYLVLLHNRDVDNNVPNPVTLDPPNFDVVIPINILNLCNVAWFFYSTSLNIIVIVFTGTYNDELVTADITYFQRDPSSLNNYTPGMKIHGGFYTLYESIQSILLQTVTKYTNSSTQIIVTGLSLGGAMSTICTLDLYNRILPSNIIISNLIHYSFASPRVFNNIGSEVYNKLHISTYRIQNGSDIITDVPLPLMVVSLDPILVQDFTHVNTVKYFDMNLSSYYDNHITAYLNYYNISP